MAAISLRMKLVVPLTIPKTFVDLGRGEALLDHPDHRDDAGDRRLEAELDPGVAGGVEQLVAVLGDELLVGGDHVAAGAERTKHVVARRDRCRRSARR